VAEVVALMAELHLRVVLAVAGLVLYLKELLARQTQVVVAVVQRVQIMAQMAVLA